jgi:hypothetical protein
MIYALILISIYLVNQICFELIELIIYTPSVLERIIRTCPLIREFDYLHNILCEHLFVNVL